MPATTTFHGDTHDELLLKACEKERLALNHFNFFLETCCVQIGMKKIFEAVAMPF